MKRKKIILLLLLIVLLLPFWMWLGWWLTPKRKLTVAIIDKTVLDRKGQEHISLDWVLNQQRFSKNRTSLYVPDRDYFGFFPGAGDRFRLKGLERFSPEQLQRLAVDADMVYFADTYGIYKEEWYRKVPDNERSAVLYGGMSGQDIGLLKEMKVRHKLMIAEFNAIGLPTRDEIRHQFEDLFGLYWTGWTGRWFTSLDTSENRELPHWLMDQYKRQHNGAWPFHRDGVAFVHLSGEVVILENVTDLTDPLPHIVAGQAGLDDLGLPTSIKYPFWFDVIDPDSIRRGAVHNEATAEFVISVNGKGAALLQQSHIPARFPAVLRHTGADYSFYYFSGDFCDNPLSYGTSYFKGIRWFKSFFYNDAELGERKSFFWNFYRPMMTRILEDEYSRLSSADAAGK
ncbi:MAG TPA: hypothetical protein VHC48_14665 [Puia sp.]|nr:hypothetical protein [Puia sp.]